MVFDRILKIPVQTAIQTKNSACPDLATHLPQILSKRQTERVLAKSLTAGMNGLILSFLEISLTSAVWTDHTSENNSGINHKLEIYLKESC